MSRFYPAAWAALFFLLFTITSGADPVKTAEPVISAQDQAAETGRVPAHTPEWTNPRQGDPGRAARPADEAAASVQFGDGKRGRISSVKPPTETASLCCGSVDTEANAGLNCAKLAAGKTCGGHILSCPPNCEENVGEDGSGGCYCP